MEYRSLYTRWKQGWVYTVTPKTLSITNPNGSAQSTLPNTWRMTLSFGGVVNSMYSWLQHCSLSHVILFTQSRVMGILKQQVHGKGFFTFEFTRVFGYYQCLVYPPFALNTAWTLLGILSISFWHSSTDIPSHTTWILSHSSWIPLGGFSCLASLLFRQPQRCSMGLRSGDYAGHTMVPNSCSSSQSLTFLQVCLGLLSCWKMVSDGLRP